MPELGVCFANAEGEIKNFVVIRHDKPETAFKYDKPYSVRDHRKFLMLTMLVGQFTPVPGILKTGFNRWIKKKYVPQSRAEGFLHGSLEVAGKTDLAPWIRIGSANPKIR